MATSLKELIEKRNISIEGIVNKPTPSINAEELPKEVIALVDNKMYLPRHRKLLRLHGAKHLLKLTELAQTKTKPSRWYATVTSVKNWERTLDMLNKLFRAAEKAMRVIEKVGIDKKWWKYLTKISFKLSPAAVENCIERSLSGKCPPKLFNWLVKQELQKCH